MTDVVTSPEVAKERCDTRPPGISWGSRLQALGVDGFELGDAMPPEYLALVRQLVELQVDIEGVLLFKDYLRPSLDLAPTPLDRMRITKLYCDEIVHGYTFWKMLRDLDDTVTPDRFDNPNKAQYIFGYSIDSWVDFALVNTLGDRMGAFLFRDMLSCSFRPWARVSKQVYKDERGHCALGLLNLRKICESPAGREAAQEALYKWYPASLDMFGTSNSRRQWDYVEWGLKESGNEELRVRFVDEVDPILISVGLEPPGYEYNRRFL